MPSKAADPSKPTFYLDHSTFCDALKAHIPEYAGADTASFIALMPWIERVAREANLCLSFFHLTELASWEDRASADAMVAWLEGLPIVWLRTVTAVEPDENRNWAKMAAGITPKSPVVPFAPSLLTAFQNLPIGAVSHALSTRTPVAELLKFARSRTAAGPSMTKLAELIRTQDRAAQAQGKSRDDVAKIIAYERRVELRTRAQTADAQLKAARDEEYASKACSGGELQDLFESRYWNEPLALPSLKVRWRFVDGFYANALEREGPSANERKKLSGSFDDMQHLAIGAAYCDVFTCDGTVSSWLGDVRTGFGLRPQISRRGLSADGFAKALMATWP